MMKASIGTRHNNQLTSRSTKSFRVHASLMETPPLTFSVYAGQQSGCFDGHFTVPYEQNTQQSPSFGFKRAWQTGHS